MKFRNQFLKYYCKPAGEDGADGGGADGDKNTPPEDTPPEDTPRPSDKEAELLKEIMRKKTKLTELNEKLAEQQTILDKFKDVDLERYSTLLESEKQARLDAEKAEQEKLRTEGKFDELVTRKEQEHQGILEQMRTQHTQELESLKAQLTDVDGSKNSLLQQIEGLTIGSAFGNSTFIREKLVSALTPERTKKLYGDHFDFENGEIIGYDKPRGVDGRTRLVDKDGHAVGFDEAIARIIEKDADAASMLKSNAKQGAGSGSDNESPSQDPEIGTGMNRILYSLNNQK